MIKYAFLCGFSLGHIVENLGSVIFYCLYHFKKGQLTILYHFTFYHSNPNDVVSAYAYARSIR